VKQNRYEVGKPEVTEGQIETEKLAELVKLLDDEKVKAKQDEVLSESLRIGDGTVTLYVIDRGERLQAATIWQLTNVLGTGFTGPTSKVIDNGSDILKPVRQWVRSHVKGGSPATLVNHCDPVQ
jgi:hypothetical protein